MNNMEKSTGQMRSTEIVDPVGETRASQAIGFVKNDHPNCSANLFDNLKRNPDNIAITGPLGTKTYRELCADAAKWGNAFDSAGLKSGDRIAFFLDDTPTYPAAFFGAVRAGFVPVLLNIQSSTDLLQFFLIDSGAKIAVCEADFVERLALNESENSNLDQIIVANGNQELEDVRFVHAVHFILGSSDTLECATTGPDDMAFWMYSSGSTGNPKGIVHLHHDMAYTALSYGAHILKLRPNDICFSVPKIFFAYGFGNSFTFPFSVGASSVLMPGRPNAKRVLDTIETFRPTVLFGLPTLYTALYRSEGVENRDFSSLRLCLSAAEILSKEVFNAWKRLTNVAPVEGFGSTEMLHIYLSNTVNDKRHASAGMVVPGYEVVLKDIDGYVVGPDEEGVMWIRGDSSAPLYWNRTDKTEETMQGDWVYSGDRFIENDGFYFFQGRADDLIKVSGQWVWPLEVERCLNEHPLVHECAVLAHELHDKRMTVRAVVRLCENVEPDDSVTEQLQNYIRNTLMPHKYPRIIDYVDQLPKTGTGKIDRQAIAKTAPE